jgi:Flp pilus assembly protein TadG
MAPLAPADLNRRWRGQALVELALVMPLLVGIVAVLFQFGLLFVAYLSIVNETRDIGRYVAVHPDVVDGTAADCPAASTATSLWNQVCDDAPSVINAANVLPSFSPICATLSNGKCALRTAGTAVHISLTYNASSIIFLPTHFRLGSFLQVEMPSTLPAYDYYVMVEQH